MVRTSQKPKADKDDSAVRIDESLHRPLDKTQAENHSLSLSIP